MTSKKRAAARLLFLLVMGCEGKTGGRYEVRGKRYEKADWLRASAEGKFSYKKQKAKSCTKGKNTKRFPFWRERGTDARRWKVDCYMLEHRKGWSIGKNKNVRYNDFIKNFRFLTQISILISQICFFPSSLAYSIL